MLAVEYGPFHPALEEAFLRRISLLSAKPGRGPIAVVAPSRAMADRLERLAAVEGKLALLDVRFHTFYSLALAIVEDTGWPDLELVGDPVFHDKIVDGLLDRGGAFSSQARRPRALAGAVRASLRDLIDAGVDASSLSEHFGEDLIRDAGERERLSTLLTLMQSYERRLEELRVLSPSGLTCLAAERAAGSQLLARFEAVLYYGFYDLTGLQLSFFQSVSARCETFLFFPYRRAHAAFGFADGFFEQNLGGAREKKELPARTEGTALKGALDRLFSAAAPAKAEVAGALRVINASGARDEVWACAKEILRLVEEEGASYEDIGVVARTLEPYRAALEDVFAENSIPLTASAGQPVLRHPLAKNALNLLSLRRRDFPAADVAQLLSSPYFQAGELRSGGRWRRVVAALGVKAGWLQWRGKLEGRLPQQPELEPLWKLLSGLRAGLGEPAKTWADLSGRALSMLERHLALPESPSAEERQAWDAARSAVSSLALFDRLGLQPSWPELLDSLEDKLRRQTLEPAGGGRGVRAMGAMDARGERFPYLFLIGLKEKSFPRQVQEDPLLRDLTRAALRHPAGYWLHRKSSGYDEERLLFYCSVSAASRALYCVYPRSDEDGKAEVPSLYLRELCRAAGVSLDEESVNTRVWRQPAQRLARCDFSLLSPKEASLRLVLEGRSPAEYLRAAGRPQRALESALERLPALLSSGPAGPCDGIIGPAREWSKSLSERGLSPSAFDELARCPFQFFAGRLLGLGGEEEAAEKGELAAWARGKLYHEVLEEFYKSLPPAVWDGADFVPALSRSLEAAFSRRTWKDMGVYPVLWDAERQSMEEALRDFVAWDLSELKALKMRPREFELELEGPAPAGALKLRGRLDRLDADEQGRRFRVVDYKTRWPQAGKLATLVDRGRLHQLPVYAELSQARLGPEAEFVGADILSLRDSPERTGLPRSHRYGADDWRAQRARFFDAVAARARQAAEGVFPIRPEDGDYGYCRRCDFALLCRKNHGPSRRRAASVPEAGGKC